MNRISFMIVLAIIGFLAAIGIMNYMSESVPAQILPKTEEAVVEEIPVVKQPDATTEPVKTPENKQQVMPQPKPTPVRVVLPEGKTTETQYETRGN